MNSEKEFNRIMDFLTREAMSKLGISKRTAELRIKAIHQSGILAKFGEPGSLTFQVAIDAAMQIPQFGEKEV